MFIRGFVFFITLMFLPYTAAARDFIRDIAIAAKSTDLAKGESAEISYNLEVSCKITVMIVDISGNIVRELLKNEEQQSGDKTIYWDGRDDKGQPLSDGVYFVIIRGRSQYKGIQTYNPTAAPWGEEVLADPVSWQRDKQHVQFTVPKPALCRLRVYIKNGGPLYMPLTGWQFFAPGSHTIPWNGRDLQNVLQVTDQPDYKVGFDGFSLPAGTIFITGSSTPTGSLPAKDLKKYPIHPPHGHNVAYLTSEPDSIAPDPFLDVKIQGNPAALQKQVAVHVDLAKGLSPAHQLREDFELYLFVDGKLDSEINRAALPQTIEWDTSKYTDGDHIITVNILSTEDRAGTFSTKVGIANLQ